MDDIETVLDDIQDMIVKKFELLKDSGQICLSSKSLEELQAKAAAANERVLPLQEIQKSLMNKIQNQLCALHKSMLREKRNKRKSGETDADEVNDVRLSASEPGPRSPQVSRHKAPRSRMDDSYRKLDSIKTHAYSRMGKSTRSSQTESITVKSTADVMGRGDRSVSLAKSEVIANKYPCVHIEPPRYMNWYHKLQEHKDRGTVAHDAATNEKHARTTKNTKGREDTSSRTARAKSSSAVQKVNLVDTSGNPCNEEKKTPATNAEYQASKQESVGNEKMTKIGRETEYLNWLSSTCNEEEERKNRERQILERMRSTVESLSDEPRNVREGWGPPQKKNKPMKRKLSDQGDAGRETVADSGTSEHGCFRAPKLQRKRKDEFRQGKFVMRHHDPYWSLLGCDSYSRMFRKPQDMAVRKLKGDLRRKRKYSAF